MEYGAIENVLRYLISMLHSPYFILHAPVAKSPKNCYIVNTFSPLRTKYFRFYFLIFYIPSRAHPRLSF
jgi:hypothetical protein